MSRKFTFIFLIFLLLNLSKLQDSSDQLGESEELEEDYDAEQYFKDSLKQYLIQNNLFESERAIKPEEMKKIFLDVILNGEPDTPGELGQTIQDLTEYFVNTYYKDRREIKGKEIYNLIDINEISMKFDQMIGNNPYFETNDDDDSRDAVGEPNPDV